MTGRADYYDRQERRRERLEARAERLSREGAAKIESGFERLRAIPFGQPILVGHYSEKGDRNYRRKAGGSIDKGFALQKQAGEAAARAASVGTAGISSDNPDAIEELQAKLAKLEALQARMTAANKLVRKGDVAGLAVLMGSEAIAAQLMQPDYCGRLGFASYQLTNNGANIRRIKDRIAHLGREATRQPSETLHNSGVRMVENVEENRVQLFFPGKPDEATRAMLKGRGFRWSPMEGAWQRQLNNGSIYAARNILESLTG